MQPTAEDASTQRAFVEPRWPVALAIGGFLAINATLRIVEPDTATLGPRWVVFGVEVATLVMLLVADPTRVIARRAVIRRTSLALVIILAGAVMLSTAVLIADLISGGQVTNSASALLASEALVWLGNSLIFGLLYWLLDSGGPVAAFAGSGRTPTLRSRSS